MLAPFCLALLYSTLLCLCLCSPLLLCWLASPVPCEMSKRQALLNAVLEAVKAAKKPKVLSSRAFFSVWYRLLSWKRCASASRLALASHS